MTDALINNKPQFVRLFCENGLNILDYLTYGRLESLYSSLSDSSLAYILLWRHLSERQGVAGSQPSEKGSTVHEKSSKAVLSKPVSMKGLSLYEVMIIIWISKL